MFKQQVKVEITTSANFTATADDAVRSGQGTAAYGAIENHRDVIIDAGTTKTIIPYGAIDHAVVTLTMSEVADPEDPTCVTNDNTGGNTGGGGDPTPTP